MMRWAGIMGAILVLLSFSSGCVEEWIENDMMEVNVFNSTNGTVEYNLTILDGDSRVIYTQERVLAGRTSYFTDDIKHEDGTYTIVLTLDDGREADSEGINKAEYDPWVDITITETGISIETGHD